MGARDDYPELTKVVLYSHAPLDRVDLHIQAADALATIDTLRAQLAECQRVNQYLTGAARDAVTGGALEAGGN